VKNPTLESHATQGTDTQELERIRSVYRKRGSARLPERYCRIQPDHLFRSHEKEAAMAALFRAAGLHSLRGLQILDVGCGRGETLRQLLEYGADPERLYGIDLMGEYVRESQRLGPHLKLVCGSAADLPFPDYSFQMVCQSMLFTSVLNGAAKRQIAGEIRRVLAPGGKFLWYDFAYDNPWNPDVRGVKRREIASLFPGFRMRLRRITVAPPLARKLGWLGPAVYHVVAQVRLVCTHYLCLMEKQ
jgi:ubiquinone/menaquinone biosynthesis C-methylase UbiE